MTFTAEQMTLKYWVKWFVFLAVMAVLGNIISSKVFGLSDD